MRPQQRKNKGSNEDAVEELNPQDAFRKRTKSVKMDDESYMFRSLVTDSRKICIDKCLANHTSNIMNHQEKTCLKRCQDVMGYVSLNTFFGMQAALTIDDLIRHHAEKAVRQLD